MKFDEDGDDDARNHPLRLHRLHINQIEDSSIFVVGRAHIPARHGQTIHQSFHRPGNYLAPPLCSGLFLYQVQCFGVIFICEYGFPSLGM